MSSIAPNVPAEFSAYSASLNMTRSEVVTCQDTDLKFRLLTAIDQWNADYYDVSRLGFTLDSAINLGGRYQRIAALAFLLRTGGETHGVLPTGQ